MRPALLVIDVQKAFFEIGDVISYGALRACLG
jgi:nicotinamidase-related amidase